MYKGYLIDLDGTAYLGNNVINQTIDFTNKLLEKNIPFKFVTNNSSNTEEDVVNKLNKMGYNIGFEHICTTARTTANYLVENHKDDQIYVIGDGGLKEAILENNLNVTTSITADVVVCGYSNKVTYTDFADAALAIRNGAKFISTNPDIALPSERGMLPGNGSFVALLECTTQTKAITMGKPSHYIMNEALAQMKLNAKDVAMIGDNYDTDIMSGINIGMDTIYVQTGLTSLEEIKQKAIKPTHICHTLADFNL